jgi:hypothetical protein
MTMDLTIPRIKSTHAIYSLLIIANLFMGMTVLEQGRVIETQRVLIKNLFRDTTHMAAMRLKEAVSRK